MVPLLYKVAVDATEHHSMVHTVPIVCVSMGFVLPIQRHHLAIVITGVGVRHRVNVSDFYVICAIQLMKTVKETANQISSVLDANVSVMRIFPTITTTKYAILCVLPVGFVVLAMVMVPAKTGFASVTKTGLTMEEINVLKHVPELLFVQVTEPVNCTVTRRAVSASRVGMAQSVISLVRVF